MEQCVAVQDGERVPGGGAEGDSRLRAEDHDAAAAGAAAGEIIKHTHASSFPQFSSLMFFLMFSVICKSDGRNSPEQPIKTPGC